jgi:hypothetical protein
MGGEIRPSYYDGYHKLARTDGIERLALACRAHVRRRFVDAVKV